MWPCHNTLTHTQRWLSGSVITRCLAGWDCFPSPRQVADVFLDLPLPFSERLRCVVSKGFQLYSYMSLNELLDSLWFVLVYIILYLFYSFIDLPDLFASQFLVQFLFLPQPKSTSSSNTFFLWHVIEVKHCRGEVNCVLRFYVILKSPKNQRTWYARLLYFALYYDVSCINANKYK